MLFENSQSQVHWRVVICVPFVWVCHTKKNASKLRGGDDQISETIEPFGIEPYSIQHIPSQIGILLYD